MFETLKQHEKTNKYDKMSEQIKDAEIENKKLKQQELKSFEEIKIRCENEKIEYIDRYNKLNVTVEALAIKNKQLIDQNKK